MMQLNLCVVLIVAAVVASTAAVPINKTPAIWNKLMLLNREQRVMEVQEIMNPTTRSLLDNQVIALINALLAKPNSDPLELAFIKINITKDFADLHGNMDTVTVTGLSKLVVDVMKINPLSLKMDFGVSIPKYGMRGNYDFNGVLGGILPLYGKGPFTLSADAVKIAGSIQMGTNLQGNVYIKSLTLDLGLEGFFVDFQMLLGSAELSDVVNEMLNDVGMGFFTKFEKSIETTVANYIIDWFNTTFEGYTLKEIIDLILGGGKP